MQHIRHFGLEGWIPALHVVADLVRPKLSLMQDRMQFGAAEVVKTFETPAGIVY
jgi:hypothetical protein